MSARLHRAEGRQVDAKPACRTHEQCESVKPSHRFARRAGTSQRKQARVLGERAAGFLGSDNEYFGTTRENAINIPNAPTRVCLHNGNWNSSP